MRGLDLFSGIAGGSLAMEAAGIEVAAHAEIEPFCCRVLGHHYPNVPNLGDVSHITEEQIKGLGKIDVISFGSPCQDWSVAGKRLGLKGHRSSLFHEAIRIIRLCKPRFAVFENVPGLFSSTGGWDFASVLDEMAESGALDIAWRVLDAQWFGVPQRRRRIFLVADFRGESAGEILSISEGVQILTQPRRGRTEEDAGCTGNGFAFALRGRDEGARVEVSGDRTSSIRGEGGSSRDYMAVAFAENQRGELRTSETHPQLTAGGGKPGQGFPAVMAPMSVREDQRTGNVYEMPYFSSVNGPGGKPGQGYHAVRRGMSVRRLTPLECERLQGFPDGWTDIPGASDSARYRALGNAWAIPVGVWVMKRLARYT